MFRLCLSVCGVLTMSSKKENYFEARARQFLVSEEELKAVASPPKNALVELTNACNHACIFCKNPDQNRAASTLSIPIFTDFIQQAVEMGLLEVGLYATGEPFLTKNIEEYVSIAKSSGVKRVYLTTNGALASLDAVKSCVESGLDSIKFSINAASREDYRIVHGVDDFDKVLSNVRGIYEWKIRNSIPLQLLCSCVIIPALKNVEQSHRSIFQEYFEDIAYGYAGSQGGQAFDLPFDGSLKDNVFGDLNVSKAVEDIEPCQMVWNRYHLTAEGYLTACCVDYENDLVFGDLKRNQLSTIWNNDLARKLRQAHIDKKLNHLLCKQCLTNCSASHKPLSDIPINKKPVSVIKKQTDRLEKRFIEIEQL